MIFGSCKILTAYLLIALTTLRIECQKQVKENELNLVIDFGLSSNLSNMVTEVQNKDNYYVDIGANNPYTTSITLGLEMLGWRGINTNPNHYIINQFQRVRPYQQNIITAIGQESRFSAFTYSSSSGKQQKNGSSAIKYMVPEISLGELCSKYYQKRPKAIVIGPSNNVDQVIFGNNWGDIKCHPDIFLISNFEQKKGNNTQGQSGQKYNFLLSTKSYIRSQIQLQDYSLYIRNNVMVQYTGSYQRANQRLQFQRVIKLEALLTQMNKVFKDKIDLQNIEQSNAILYYVKKDRQISQKQIRKLNADKLEKIKSKNGQLPFTAIPIILMNFNPDQNVFLLKTCSFIINRIKLNSNSTANISFININIDSTQIQKQKLSIFVLDQYSKRWAPKIVITNQKCPQYSQTQTFFSAPTTTTQEENRKWLSLEAEIFQVIFTVTFISLFLIFTLIILVFLCRSLKRDERIQQQILQNSTILSLENVQQNSTISQESVANST